MTIQNPLKESEMGHCRTGRLEDNISSAFECSGHSIEGRDAMLSSSSEVRHYVEVVPGALRTAYGIRSRACLSDTTSVSVYGEYSVYNDDEDASVISPDGDIVPDPADSIHITRGYSKDHRLYLRQYMIGNVIQEDSVPRVNKSLDGNTANPK